MSCLFFHVAVFVYIMFVCFGVGFLDFLFALGLQVILGFFFLGGGGVV